MPLSSALLYPRGGLAYWPRHRINMPGFFLALVFAPVFLTLVSAALVIPGFALAFDAPLYLLAGTPVLLWLIARGITRPSHLMLAGFLTNLSVCPAGLGIAQIAPQIIHPDTAVFYLLCSLVFAPLWSGVFTWLHARFDPQQGPGK